MKYPSILVRIKRIDQETGIFSGVSKLLKGVLGQQSYVHLYLRIGDRLVA